MEEVRGADEGERSHIDAYRDRPRIGRGCRDVEVPQRRRGIEVCGGGSTATASETPTISETVMTAAGKTAGWSLTATVSVTATTTAEGCTVSVTAAAVLPSKSRSPAYCAVIVCVPVESTTSIVASRASSTLEPSAVAPSKKVTEPVGIPEPGSTKDTEALSDPCSHED